MIGDNPQWQAVADKAQAQPAVSVAAPSNDKPLETPKAAPTTAVASSALPNIEVASVTPKPSSAEQELTKTPDQATVGLRTRRRSRSTSGDR